MKLPILALFVLGLAPLGCGSDDESSSDSAGSGVSGSAGISGAGGSSGSGSGGAATAGGAAGALDPTGMSFFVTSTGSGADGGNLGGLAGADAWCEQLADAVGEGGRTWSAYLCTSTVDARDRIGPGPWYNSAGDRIAGGVDELHTTGVSNDDPQHVLDENGQPVPGNEHDILTGCNEQGRLQDAANTCQDWTSSSVDDAAWVGHSDHPAPPFDMLTSWNSTHATPGCDEASLIQTAGAGRIYCFANDDLSQ